ncbi:MAG: hypothetical protein II841_04895 [Bacteroidales bacterium]|nr:hypothetical protein [Bacteroidales bacterium]
MKTPKNHTTAYSPLYAGVVRCLGDAGLRVGGTAGYPRVEVHSISEGQRLDKEGAVRSLSLTTEAISDKSLAGSKEMNEEAMEALTTEGALNLGDDWRVLDVVPDQLLDLPEVSDSARILYRTQQTYEIWVERVKTEEQEETETETEGEPEETENENNEE